MTQAHHSIRPDVRAFLDMLEAQNAPKLYEVPVDQAREGSRAMQMMVDAPARQLAVKKDISCPGPAGAIPLRVYDSRPRREPGPVIVFLHGGGFVVGDIDVYDSFCTEVAEETGLPVVSVEYRLAPEHPFPAAPDDCEAAARWVAGSPPELGFEVTGIITMGDSAGGNLTIVTTNALIAAPADVPVLAQAPIYPIAGPLHDLASFAEFGENYFLDRKVMGWFDRAYAPAEGDPRNQPLLEPDHSRTPPTLVLTAGLDPLRDSGRDYAARLASQGVDVAIIEARGVIHGFITIRKAIPSTAPDLARFYAALLAMLGGCER